MPQDVEATGERMLVVRIPEALIPGLTNLSGPVLLYLDKLKVEDGFALTENEFVASLDTLQTVISMAGVTPETFAILPTRA